MSYFVNVLVLNKTDENFANGVSNALYGYWTDFPSSIAGNQSASFQITDYRGSAAGSEGTFTYDICDVSSGKKLTTFETYQTDPWTHDNVIRYDTSPKPAALYTCSFRARVGDGDWTYNSVAASGHPVYVEYTIEYERRRPFRFSLIQITAHSDHPVRNTRKELIAGDHTLWSNSDPSIYPDGTHGSFQPNVFAYKFGSQVAASGILNVTVVPLDLELIGAEVLVFGTKDGNRVIQSDYFFFTSLKDVTVQAHVINPATSRNPFSLNADVDWGMELRLSHQPLQRVGEGITRLELYWIATTLHRAFKAYIPVTFLRNVLPIEMTIRATNYEFYQDMTKKVFNDYHKRYETVSGAAQFDVFYYGGNFNEALYLLEDPTEQLPGTLFPFVNCMDQAAMLELSCSLLGGFSSTSWLYQMPFGYITPTHLVGIKNTEGALINVNNPFFGTDIRRAEVPSNDLSRHPFSLHVYVGHSKPFEPDNDGIYDACSGPHFGTETIAQYITSAIDTQTTLYHDKPWECDRPGTVANVFQGIGVTSIDGQEIFPQSCSMPPLTEPLSRLVNIAVANTVGPLAHVGWAHLPIWLNATLGDAWDIRYKQVSVSETGAQALWLISDANVPNSPIRVYVNVVSVIAQDGNIDMERSAAVVKENINSIVMSTERHDVWTSGTLPGLEGVTLQYANHVAAGRIVLVAGNVVIDISGMTSYEALLPYALKLLNRTVRRDFGPLDRSPPIVPMLQRQAIINTSGTSTLGETEAGIITVTGIDTRFSVVFFVSCKIAVANAGSEEHGVLFDRHIVKEVDNREGCTIEFLFIAREIGRHHVRVCVADLETMIAAKSDLEVEVVGTQEEV